MKSWPKVKLGQVQVGSNIALLAYNYLYFAYLPLIALILPYMPYSPIQKCRHECSLGVNLVIDIFFNVASDTLPPY